MNINANNPSEMARLNHQKKIGLVLIWFYATWCGHCNDMENEWEQLSNNHPEEVNIAKVESENYNDYVKTSNEDEVRGYPTIRLYYKNKMVKEYDGDRSFKDIYSFLQKYIDENPKTKLNNLMILKGSKKNKHNKKLLKVIKNTTQDLHVPKLKRSKKEKINSNNKEKPKKKNKKEKIDKKKPKMKPKKGTKVSKKNKKSK